MGERVRLVGIARALVGQTDRRVLVQRTIVSDDQGAFGRIDDLDAFEIEIEGRRRVRVELSKEARIEPLATKKKKWGDLEDDPSFASIKDRGPGPHVTVTVKRSAIEEGDRIALSGDEKEFFFEEPKQGMRDAPKRELSVISADLVAGGDDAERILDHALGKNAGKSSSMAIPPADKRTRKQREKKPRTLRSYITVPRAFVFAGLVSLLFGTTMRRSPGFVDTLLFASLFFGTAAYAAGAGTLPRFVIGNKVAESDVESEATAVVGGMLAIFTALIFAFLGDAKYAWTAPPGRNVEEGNAAYFVAVIALVYLVVLLVTFVRSSRRRAALLQTILDAPPFTSMPDETKWGSIEGVVRDPTPIKVGGGPRALANVISREVRPGSDPDIVTEDVLNEGTFFVDSEIGSFELDPRDATWASAVRQVVTDTEKKKVHADVVAIGGRIVVAGRAVTPAKGEPARFIAGRTDSLVFYATARDVDARAKTVALLRRRRNTVALLAFCSVAIIGIVARYAPELPKVHIEGGGD